MKKIFAIMMAALSVFAVSCNKGNFPGNDAAYEEFAQSIEEIEKQWTMVYNVTVNNEENAALYGENPAYLEIVDNAAFALSGVQQNIDIKKTWAEECYQAGTLGKNLDEILGSLEELQIQLTQVLNVYNDAVKELGQDSTYEELAMAIESLEQQWTMVYNSTVNNADDAALYGENPAYQEIVDNANVALSAVAQNIETKKTWIEESYQAGTLAEDAEEIYSTFEEIQIQLTQTLNVYNDGVKALAQDAAYEELAMAIESLEQQWTMVYNSTVNNADDAALYGENPAYQEIVANASTALSAVQQNIATKKTWIEECYQAGTLAEDAEEIAASFEEIQIQLTQTLNTYNAAVAELGGSELDAIYDELVAAWDQLDAQWYMVYNVTVNNSEDAAKAKAKGKEGIYEEIVFQASVNLTAIRTTLQEKLALMDYSYEDGTLVDKAEEIYMSFETDIQIPLTQVQMNYNQQFAELIGE